MRKPFDELLDEELTALTREQVSDYIDLECAEIGVPLLPESPGEPPRQEVVPDTTVFTVADLHFIEEEDAMKIVKLANTLRRVRTDYFSGPGYQKRIVPAEGPAMVTTDRAFSADVAATRRTELGHYAELKKQFDERMTAYDKVYKSREKVVVGINDTIYSAKLRLNEKETLRKRYARYLELADGNRRTAARFVESSVPNARVLCPELFEFTDSDPADVLRNPKRTYQEENESGVEL